MSFVGIPQACESIAIDLGVLSGKLREYAQALRRTDIDTPGAEKMARVLSKKAKVSLEEFLAILPPEPVEETKKRKRK